MKCKLCGFRSVSKEKMVMHLRSNHRSQIVSQSNRSSDNVTDYILEDMIASSFGSYASFNVPFSGGGGSFDGGGASDDYATNSTSSSSDYSSSYDSSSSSDCGSSDSGGCD